MRFSAASLLALAASAVATSTITEVVTTYETYCPEATSFVSGSSTIHVTTVRSDKPIDSLEFVLT